MTEHTFRHAGITGTGTTAAAARRDWVEQAALEGAPWRVVSVAGNMGDPLGEAQSPTEALESALAYLRHCAADEATGAPDASVPASAVELLGELSAMGLAMELATDDA